jgi:hypothetical protein
MAFVYKVRGAFAPGLRTSSESFSLPTCRGGKEKIYRKLFKTKTAWVDMLKRAMGDNVMIYLLAVIILGGIALVGWKMVSNSVSGFCKTELADFQILLGEETKTLRNGENVEKSMDVPCKADRIYLFDASSKPSPAIFTNPVLKDAVASNAAKNVYVEKDGEMLSSFEVPFLDVPYPYFTCMMPSSGKIDFFLKGLGRGIGVEPVCDKKGCTIVSIPSSSDFMVEREYHQCDGLVRMDIRITPKTANVPFTYKETIPYPHCIEFPNEQYGNIEEFDPLALGDTALTYHSTGLSEPLTLSYDITIPLSDACIGEITGELS